MFQLSTMLKTQYLFIVLFLYKVSKVNGRNFGEMEEPDVNNTEGNTTKIIEALKNSVYYKNDTQFYVKKKKLYIGKDEDEFIKIVTDNPINSVLVTYDNHTCIGKPVQNGTEVDIIGKNGVKMGKLWKNSTHFGVFEEIVTENNVPENHIILKNGTETSLSKENGTHIGDYFENGTQISVNEQNSLISDLLKENGTGEHGLKGGNETHTSINTQNANHDGVFFENGTQENGIIIWENRTHIFALKVKNDTCIKNHISDQDEHKNNSEIVENNIQKHEYQHHTNIDEPRNSTENDKQEKNDRNTKQTISNKFPSGFNISMKAGNFKVK